MSRPCYPVYTAGKCMRPWQVAALGAFTAVLVACWVPVAVATRLARRGEARRVTELFLRPDPLGCRDTGPALT